jgi:NitT/TauT family transport system ATP-binding protein
MVDIDGIRVCYGDETALDNVSLSIDKNSTCAVIGASGCGKTTLLYALAGIIRPTSGKITIDGDELNGIRKGTSLILQDYGLLPWKNVWDNIAFPLKSRDFKKDEVNARVSSTLKSLGIEEHAKKFPGELSGGQKQRVGIGRAIVLEPDLLLMDEASSALDAITKEHIQDLILSIYKENQITLVMVTHSIEEAVFLGQKIVIMDKGRIKNIMDNPWFGIDDSRDNMEFYKICLQVRRWLNEEA